MRWALSFLVVAAACTEPPRAASPTSPPAPSPRPETALGAQNDVEGNDVEGTAEEAHEAAEPIGPECREDEECVLVTGDCDGLVAVHRDVAAAVDEENRARLEASACAGRPRPAPVRARCYPPRCVAEPLDRPEWRACQRDADCTLEWRDCMQYEPISVRFAREARAAWIGPECPSIAPLSPEVRCVHGNCTIGWAGP